MHFVKPSSLGYRIVEGGEGNADKVNQLCLRSDLDKKGCNVSSDRERWCRAEYLRESESIIEIE
jgi:hypothetical protein